MISLVLSLNVNNIFAEKITIRINGEKYSKEMPETLEDSKELIRTLAEMCNNADGEIVILNNKYKRDSDKLQNKINDLEKQIKILKKDIDTTSDNIDSNLTSVEKITSAKTSFTTFLNFGPVIGSDKSIGSHLGIIGEYRIIRNLHIGLNAFCDVFNNTSRNFDAGIGFIVGLSLY